MKKYKILIVEDDTDILEELIEILKSFDSVIDIADIVSATTFQQAQNIILSQKVFDVSIFDKRLDNNRISFTLIPKSNREHLGIIVLNTLEKKEQEELELHQNLSDYLILDKPHNEINVGKLLGEISMRIKQRGGNDIQNKKLLVKENDNHIYINQGKIVFIEVKKNTIHLHYDAESSSGRLKVYLLTNTLSKVLEILDSDVFQRISDSFAIHMDYFNTINETERKLTLKRTDKIFDIHDKYYDELKAWFIKFKRQV